MSKSKDKKPRATAGGRKPRPVHMVATFDRRGAQVARHVDVEALLDANPTLADEVIRSLDKSPVKLPQNIALPVLTALPEDVPGIEPEPIYKASDRDDIQGNIFPGFNKDHQTFLFFRVTEIKPAKEFLRWISKYITSMEETLAFRRLYRSKSLRLGRKDVLLSATWANIGFSYEGIVKLVGAAEADRFGDDSFTLGLAARSSYLGDPTSGSSKGHPDQWVVGGTKKPTDILVILASDTPDDLRTLAELVKAEAETARLVLVYEQLGATLPGDLAGHEHFGFRDGVSQPGVRGKASATPGDYLTPRYIDHSDDRARYRYMAKPGQLLTWPGQFLLGEKRQHTENFEASAPPASNFPLWARRGSYLVARRLVQDVQLFWGFVRAAAGEAGIDPVKFASMLVGRWPSGAPIMRVPGADVPALGNDPFANNHFIFDDDTGLVPLHPIPGYPGDDYPAAKADFLATVCPHFAHIRKVNPRDTMSDMGKPADGFLRMILRRGIPFGKPIIGRFFLKRQLTSPRGLMFVSYQSSIRDQFEFLQRRWSNSPIQPNLGGHDPIIGQTNTIATRERFIDFPTPVGIMRFRLKNEWVVPTGGGYYFAPPIAAIAGVLGA